MTARRDALRRRYLSLGAGELSAAAVFAVLAYVSVGPRMTGDGQPPALWAALVPLLAVLIQAGVYWLLARRWVGCGAMPVRIAALYRVLRVADPLLLAVGIVGVVAWLPGSPGAVVVVFAVWAFGVLEYVNYFVIRLAYPPTRWFRSVRRWRTPQLMKDVAAAS